MIPTQWIVPDWPATRAVNCVITTRAGGVSLGPYGTCNLSFNVGDDAAHVAENRRRLRAGLPDEPRWLKQVHGYTVLPAEHIAGLPEADASYTHTPGVVCGVLIADCMPVFFCARDGTAVAVAHAGWRGLAGGVLEATVAAMGVRPSALLAYLGPAIGPRHFEVGDDVRQAFAANAGVPEGAFVPLRAGKWLANLHLLAAHRLIALGIGSIHGEPRCTVSEPDSFFSYRRDKTTGRMAALIAIGVPVTGA